MSEDVKWLVTSACSGFYFRWHFDDEAEARDKYEAIAASRVGTTGLYRVVPWLVDEHGPGSRTHKRTGLILRNRRCGWPKCEAGAGAGGVWCLDHWLAMPMSIRRMTWSAHDDCRAAGRMTPSYVAAHREARRFARSEGGHRGS